ncbi:MAG TPA: PQQ-binding-like beta-propeller repeat protein [Tepidisphaeraceae bacterium]|nr:PQQ-binding-like beta-propeller repeat protein [Tepidisphaeraceae bacterium]
MHKATNNLKGRVSLFLVFCATALLVNPSIAQIPDPQTLAGRDSKEGVFVRDSALAVEKLALAQRMEHLHEWDKAAEIYQEILKGFSDRLVPSQLNSENLIFQYSSVTPLVQERLARWPQDALAAYRSHYEGDAAALLESAKDDPSQLLKVVNLYFVTDSAKRSALRLMDIYFERGEFAAASWLGQRMIKFHPMLGDDKARFLFREALADHVSGNDEKAQASLKDLTAQFPNLQGNVRATPANLSEVLTKELSTGSARPAESWSDSWPTAFGNSERSRVNQISTYGGAKLMSVALDKLNLRAVPASQQEAMRNQNAADMGNGLMTGIFPVVDNGEMFFQDNANVYAVSLESDTPLPGWAATYSGEHAGHYSISGAWPTPRSQQCTLTITEDSVFAVMGLPDVVIPNWTGVYDLRETRLVCLDRRTGAEKWVAMPKKFPEANASLRELDLTGSPLVVGDTVFVQARGGKGMQFEDSYVLAFERTTGKLKWACYLASANTGKQFWAPELGTLLGQNYSHLAYSNGRIFSVTNIGAVASVDAYDGQIIWLDIYQRNVVQPQPQFRGWGRGWRGAQQQRFAGAMTSVRPWTFNPTIVSNGRVFVLPNDSSNLYVYDAGSGLEIKRISMDSFDSSFVLLGVVDDKLIVHNDNRVYCINWPAYEPGKSKQSIFWESSSLQVNDSLDNVIKGRGLVTSDSVLIPTARKLFRLALNGGKIVQMYPSGDGASWPEEEGPGNVLATGDRVIVAGPTISGSVMRVNVYADLAMASSKMETAMASAPEDAAVRLRYADILFAAGKYQEAASRLDEAIGLIGKSSANNASQRVRAFETAMSYGQKLSRDTHAPILDLAGAMYDRAGASATTPLQKVRYRLARTALAKPRNQIAAEVKLYQQILNDPELRAVPITEADGTTISAGEKARLGVDDAILRGGVAVYAPYEQEAGNAVLDAARAKNPEKLQAISLSYPNSVASARALLLAADIFESTNNPRKATQVLRQAYFRYPSAQDHERVIEALARNYLRLPNRIDVAIARLLQGAAANAAAKLTRPLILQDGTKIENVTFADAAQSLRKYRAVATGRNLLDIGLPLIQGRAKEQPPAFQPEDASLTVAGVEMLVVPLIDQNSNNRIVTYSSRNGVRVFAVGNTKPLITCDAIRQPPLGCAWSGQNVLVWSKSEMAFLSPDSGQTLWSWIIENASPLEIMANNEQPDQDQANPAPRQQVQEQIIRGPAQIPLRGGGQIIIRGNGVLRIGGVQIMPTEPTPKPSEEQIAQVALINDRAIVSTTDGRIIALDLDGGKLLWQTSIGEHAPNQLVANDDFIVGRLNEDNNINSQVVVFDAATGQVLTRRNFGTDGDSGSLVNLALSPDGIALLLTNDRLIGKDLFEPGGLEKPTYQFTTQASPLSNFMLSTSPDHLQIVGDRIILVGTVGNRITLSVLSLRDGKMLRAGPNDATLTLDNSAMQARFAVRCVGSTLYMVTQREVRRFDLDSGVKSQPGTMPMDTALGVRDVYVTKNYLVTLTDLAGAGSRANQGTKLRMQAFSRALDSKGVESGRLDFDEPISSGNAQTTAWQVVDGGIYFLTKDEKLHFLHGAAN